MRHNDQTSKHKKVRRSLKFNMRDNILKKSLYLFIPFLIVLGCMFVLPENFRRNTGWTIISVVVIAAIKEFVLPWVAKTEKIEILPVLLVLFGLTIPSIIATAKPELYNIDVLRKKEEENTIIDIKHDNDLAEEIEERIAIETVVNDIDDGVFKQFYELSYVENGILKSKPEAAEDTKIQLIMDAIVDDIAQFATDKKEYTYAELNSGKYGELTNEANQEEEEYRKKVGQLDKQQKIESISSYLQKRIAAYKAKGTSELARLIGHTYAELSQYQTANNNIYSNCSAISYYFKYCYLSQPESKSKMYYEMGVRFNRIAEIAQSIYQQESSDEYKKLYIDSLYMSVAYYKLYRHSFVEDYRNNFYLARSYKLLSENMESDYNKSAYLEESLNIMFALMDKADTVKAQSKISLYKTLYNTLVEYESIPVNYWNKYNKSFVTEQKELVCKLID